MTKVCSFRSLSVVLFILSRANLHLAEDSPVEHVKEMLGDIVQSRHARSEGQKKTEGHRSWNAASQ